MQVKIINHSKHPLPAYATAGASGMDLRANLKASIWLPPGNRALISTGLHLALPSGFEAQIRPRSGWAYKSGITVLNSPGTIDEDYRGEIKVLLANLSEQNFIVEDGDRIAQLVVAPYTKVTWAPVDALDVTDRGQGGYGSTGVQ